jgi:putative transposase
VCRPPRAPTPVCRHEPTLPNDGATHASTSPMARPARLREFDYATPGAYFITIITNERAPVFGSLDEGAASIAQTAAGKMIDRWWLELAQKFPCVSLDARALMPDHFHGLLFLNCSEPIRKRKLPEVVQWFKTMTTAEYLRGIKAGQWPPVTIRLWQRGYHDHIVRSECDLERIRRYIEGNTGRLYERVHPRADTNEGRTTP